MQTFLDLFYDKITDGSKRGCILNFWANSDINIWLFNKSLPRYFISYQDIVSLPLQYFMTSEELKVLWESCKTIFH